MSILKFPSFDNLDDFLDSIPDPKKMDLAEAEQYCLQVREAIAALDHTEPKDEESEEYELWSENHEDLEDILDDILDRLEDLK